MLQMNERTSENVVIKVEPSDCPGLYEHLSNNINTDEEILSMAKEHYETINVELPPKCYNECDTSIGNMTHSSTTIKIVKETKCEDDYADYVVRPEEFVPDSKDCICYSCGESFSMSSWATKHGAIQVYKDHLFCGNCCNNVSVNNISSQSTSNQDCSGYGVDVLKLSNVAQHESVHTADHINGHKTNVIITDDSEVKIVIHLTEEKTKKNFACCECGKSFTRSYSLVTHKRTHTGEKPYACNICGKTFSASSTLSDHKRTHTGEKPYSCDICAKSFTALGSLSYHKRTHTGEKPYACDICGKSFSALSILSYHKRTHTGEKPYACDICPKVFSALSTLSYHKRTHTGEKPYACDICPKTFSALSTLSYHKRTHTGEKPYACDICPKTFSALSTLSYHKRTHTGEKCFT